MCDGYLSVTFILKFLNKNKVIKITVRTQKDVASIILGLASASLIFFVTPWARTFLDYQLGGIQLFTLGNLIGGLGLYFAWKLYKNEL